MYPVISSHNLIFWGKGGREIGELKRALLIIYASSFVFIYHAFIYLFLLNDLPPAPFPLCPQHFLCVPGVQALRRGTADAEREGQAQLASFLAAAAARRTASSGGLTSGQRGFEPQVPPLSCCSYVGYKGVTVQFTCLDGALHLHNVK